jgi:hypothetical protein
MVYLSLQETKRLLSIGFKPDYYTESVDQGDWYDYNNQIWVIGGCLFPQKNASILAPDHIYKDGIRLITIYDLFIWLNHRLTYELKKDSHNRQWNGALFSIEQVRIEFYDASLVRLLYLMVYKAIELEPSLLQWELPPVYQRVE